MRLEDPFVEWVRTVLTLQDLQRLLTGVLVLLLLMLARVLFVLSRLACAVAFVLVLVAVRLRCGCPSERDDCAFLLSRRYRRGRGVYLLLS